MYINRVFKLTMVLDANKFHRVLRKHTTLELDGDMNIDSSLTHKGITVVYRNSQYKKKVSLIVNTDIIFKGKEPDAPKLIHKLEKRIGEYFSGRYCLEDFMLAKLTLTAEINVGRQDLVAAYIRVIQRIGKVKGFSPVRCEDFNEDSSFCLNGNSNGTNFFLYDFRAVAAKGSIRDIEGILRAEIQLTTSKAIHAYSDKNNITGQILDLFRRSEEIFMSTFVQIIPYGDFYKKGNADNIVRQKVKDLRLQRRMLRLIGLIPEKKSLLLAQKAMRYREPNKLLIAFAEIGLSPVTISKRMDVKYLPSLYSYMSCNTTQQEVEKNVW